MTKLLTSPEPEKKLYKIVEVDEPGSAGTKITQKNV
jgi:hypothetical protein